MRIYNNIPAQNSRNLMNNQGIKIEKLSSGNNVNNNQTDLGNSVSDSKKITIDVFKKGSNSNNIQETNKNNSVQNASNGKTSFTIETSKVVTNSNNSNATKQNNSAQKIGDGQTSSGTKFRNNTQITASVENFHRINDKSSELDEADMYVSSIHSYVSELKLYATISASDSTTAEHREMLNSGFNNAKNNIDVMAKNLGAVDSNDKNNINFSYVSSTEDGSNKESSVNISYAATVKALGLDKIDISSKEGAMKAIESLTKASSSIENTMKEIGKGIAQLNKDYGTEVEAFLKRSSTIMDADPIKKDNVLQQVSVSAIAQANQPQNQILKLLS